MNKREERIKFLKGILKGEKNIRDLMPPEYFIFWFRNETQDYYCRKLQRVFTETEYQEFKKKAPRNILVVVTSVDDEEMENGLNTLRKIK